MKRIVLLLTIAAALTGLTATASADASDARLCARYLGSLQDGSGQWFSSQAACVRSRDVYLPQVTVSPAAVGALQSFTLTASGFHASAGLTLAIAYAGWPPNPPYYTAPLGSTGTTGAFSLSTYFSACGPVPAALTLTVTDVYGVHAQAQLQLC